MKQRQGQSLSKAVDMEVPRKLTVKLSDGQEYNRGKWRASQQAAAQYSNWEKMPGYTGLLKRPNIIAAKRCSRQNSTWGGLYAMEEALCSVS